MEAETQWKLFSRLLLILELPSFFFVSEPAYCCRPSSVASELPGHLVPTSVAVAKGVRFILGAATEGRDRIGQFRGD